jgi:hypothetical protein
VTSQSNGSSELTFTDEQLLHGQRRWSLVGPQGGVSWSTFGCYAGGIEVHSRTPEHDGDVPRSGSCDVIGAPCYGDGGGQAGRELMRRWMDSGYDNAVVRAELESWYEREFGGESR